MSVVDKGGKKRKKKGKFKKNSKHGLLSKEDLDFIVDKTKYTSEEVEEWHRWLVQACYSYYLNIVHEVGVIHSVTFVVVQVLERARSLTSAILFPLK